MNGRRTLGLISVGRRLACAALAAAILLGATGCIRSRVKITSEPSGAEVLWHGDPYGATPVTIPFIWYWYHDVRIEKPGYVPIESIERFRTPPWFMMPLDIIAEAMPFPIYDTRKRHYVLEEIQRPAFETAADVEPSRISGPGEQVVDEPARPDEVAEPTDDGPGGDALGVPPEQPDPLE